MAHQLLQVLPTRRRRLARWLVSLSDFRLSLYMLLAAAAIIGTLVIIDQRFPA